MTHISDTRWKQTLNEIQEAYKSSLMSMDRQGDIKYLDAEFCYDLSNMGFNFSWTSFKLASGSIVLQKFISESGLSKCNKSEATCLLVVGEKSENNYFYEGRYKNIWLCPKK